MKKVKRGILAGVILAGVLAVPVGGFGAAVDQVNIHAPAGHTAQHKMNQDGSAHYHIQSKHYSGHENNVHVHAPRDHRLDRVDNRDGSTHYRIQVRHEG